MKRILWIFMYLFIFSIASCGVRTESQVPHCNGKAVAGPEPTPDCHFGAGGVTGHSHPKDIY